MARDLRPSGVAEMGARPEKSWTTAPHLRQDRQPRLHFREGDKGPQRRCARRGQAAVGAPPQTAVPYGCDRERPRKSYSTPLAFVREEAEAPWVVRVPVGRRPYGVGFERKQALGTRQRRNAEEEDGGRPPATRGFVAVSVRLPVGPAGRPGSSFSPDISAPEESERVRPRHAARPDEMGHGLARTLMTSPVVFVSPRGTRCVVLPSVRGGLLDPIRSVARGSSSRHASRSGATATSTIKPGPLNANVISLPRRSRTPSHQAGSHY
jgi:hypothetical protein